MTTLDVARIPRCDPARFARLEAGLLAAGWPRPILLVAGFAEPALLLGRHQRAASAVDLPAARARGLNPVRRAGGGRSLLVGEGAVGLFLYAPPGDRLAEPAFAPDRAMNRYVRGLLAGLRTLGARSAAYFGRDFVSAESRQVATLSQESTPDGSLALEAIVAVSRPLAVPHDLSRSPPHRDPRAAGPAPVSLAELAGAAPTFEQVAAALERGWCAVHGRDPAPASGALPEAPLPPAEEDEAGLSESGLAEIPIGFVEALAGAASGRLVTPRLRGDFLAPAHVVAALEGALDGAPLDPGEVGARIDAAFRRPGAFLHGVRELRVLADAVLAAGRAAAGATAQA